MSFDVGDKVVYPHHGAAVIEKREKIEAFGEKREYLVLRLAYGDLTLKVPADNTDDVGLREVINDEEVEEVFAVLRKKEARMPTNWSRRFKNHVEKLKSGDIYQVAEVVRNLSLRDKEKGLSAGEKRMLAKARQILVSELTFAINVDEEEAERQPRRGAQLDRRGGLGDRRRRRVRRAASAGPSSTSAWATGGCSTGRSARPRATCDGVVLVVPPDRADADEPAADVVVDRRRDPGDSVRAGLAAVPSDVEVVLVHDAARPWRRRRCAAGSSTAVRGRRRRRSSRRCRSSTRCGEVGGGHRRPLAVRGRADAAGVPGRGAARAPTPAAATPPTMPPWSRRPAAVVLVVAGDPAAT